jgi:hypothetical protein
MIESSREGCTVKLVRDKKNVKITDLIDAN